MGVDGRRVNPLTLGAVRVVALGGVGPATAVTPDADVGQR